MAENKSWQARRSAAEYEKIWTENWKKSKTFERSVELRDPSKSYVFYDGPPFITGVPHFGTLLSSIVKDAVPRYWTMRGYRVERQWGWDSHGLPAENFTEKSLGIVDRKQILTDETHRFEFRENDPRFAKTSREEYEKSARGLAPKNSKTGENLPTFSLEKYIESARSAMVDNSATWKPVIDRVGRWVNFDGAYKTMDKDFMESVWWAFSKLYKAGKIYEGAKVLMYDTHFATPVAKAEVTMDNDAYQTVTDPSVYVKFQLTDQSIKALGIEKTSLAVLAWTTTPWTLPGNTALAINPNMTYVFANIEDTDVIVAKSLLEKVAAGKEYTIFKEISGEKLVGLGYKPLFDGEIFAKNPAGNYYENSVKNLAKIWPADYVSEENGTGIVHIAPVYGEEDYDLARKNGVPARETLDENGFYWPEISRKFNEIFAESFGENFREILKKAEVKTDENGNYEAFSVNKMLAKALEKTGVIWKIEMIRHEYPFNPRSKQRVMYRAIPSWFFDVQGQKPLLLAQNENINWFPHHLKHGRFAKNIEQAPDWNLSRNRFWASAMPVWKGDKGGMIVVGSYAELRELSGVELEDYHRPWVDDIKIISDDLTDEIREKYGMQNGEIFTRVEEVLDGWFESGSMPFAQMHYPFENSERFEKNYPADFIVEYIGQVRAWFYYVHLVNSSLAEAGAFGEDRATGELEAYKNVITTGVVAGNDGRKMSKSLGNYTDPNILMDQYSADALRMLLLSSPLLNGEDFALKDKDVSDIYRKLNMIWNVYDFFAMYAESENFAPEFMATENEKNLVGGNSSEKLAKFAKDFAPEKLENVLDKWIVSRFAEFQASITENMNTYNIPEAMNVVLPFLDDLSNWFLRRSRRRFAKNPDAADKAEAFKTLHFVLMEFAVAMAPFTPFLAEELFANVGGGQFGDSVHLLDWQSGFAKDESVLEQMREVREIIQKGLGKRMENDEFGRQKIRQPLSELKYGGTEFAADLEDIIAEEVNVKKVLFIENVDGVELDKKLTDDLRQEGLSREIIRAVQSARKKAGLKVDDKILLEIESDSEKILQCLEKFANEIAAETLAEFAKIADAEHESDANVEGDLLTVCFSAKN